MGKSISSSLEDDEAELIKTTPGFTTTPAGPKLSLQPKPPHKIRQQQTQERPPSSIFKPNPLILACGYLRDIIALNKIPNSICLLCSNYSSKKYKSLNLDSNNVFQKQLIINRIDDYSFHNISMGHNTFILGSTPIIKLSSSKNLKMDWNSSIYFDQEIISNKNKNCTVILTVFGDINMGKNSQLLCGHNGNIYIQCNNLIMRTGAIISTTSAENNNNNVYLSKTNSKSDLKRFGNIYMDIKKSLIMDAMATIKTGNIKIVCQQAKIGIKSSISALRKNVEISTKHGIICDENLDKIFYAKNEKKIENKNELHTSGDVIKIKERIKENVGYKLTMFEGDEDEEFECCICWNNEPNIMIKPCGHSTFCEVCIIELNPIECPICRITIADTKKF